MALCPMRIPKREGLDLTRAYAASWPSFKPDLSQQGKKGIEMEIGYGVGQQICSPPSQLSAGISMPTIEDRLKQRKFQLEANLKDVNDALEALESNPEVLKILCLISKVNY